MSQITIRTLELHTGPANQGALDEAGLGEVSMMVTFVC
jgi:hypothetical protein